MEADGLGFHLFSLLNPLVAGIGVDHRFLAMQQLCGRGQVMHVGRGRFDRVDQAVVLVHTDVDLHTVGIAFRAAVIPLVPRLGLVHLGISLALLVLVPPAHLGFALVKMELGAAIKVASMIVLLQ